MNSNKSDKLIEVFAGPSPDADILKSILQDAGIQVFLKNELMGTIAPWQVSAGGAGAVRIVIHSSDFEKAKEIIEEFEKNKNS